MCLQQIPKERVERLNIEASATLTRKFQACHLQNARHGIARKAEEQNGLARFQTCFDTNHRLLKCNGRLTATRSTYYESMSVTVE